jgi:hypothetical protein
MNVMDSSSVTNTNSDPCKVNYELIWVNDTTFLISTRAPEHASLTAADVIQSFLISSDSGPLTVVSEVLENDSVLQKHAALICLALKTRFPSHDIQTLEDHLKQQQDSQKKMEQVTGGKSSDLHVPTQVGLWNGLWQGVRSIFQESNSKKRKREEVIA